MNPGCKSFLRQLLPKSIRHQRILSGPLRGFHIVTSWHDYPAAILGRTERPLLDWFAKNVKPGETWLDIGAHYGYTAIALSKLVGTTGRVFAFEPMINTAGCVAQTRRINYLPQLIVLPFGLAGSETLEIKQLPVTRGMVDSTLCGKEGERQKDGGQAVWQEAIMVARLDWLWPRICGKNDRIDGVKIDVQGMELEVIQGMSEVIKRNRPGLVVEIHPGVSRSELLNLIKTIGYSCEATPIEPIEGEIKALFVDDHSYVFQPICLNRS